MIYSFDIFDTLITRKTAVPEGIFAIMQSELGREEFESIPLPIRNNFYQLRIMAEKLARRSYQNDKVEDVTLEQIYETLTMRGELDAAQKKQLMCLECDIEYQECVSVEKNVARIKKLLSDGETVILISDMYLPKEQIYRMLAKADPILVHLEMFVSGDCKKRKRTGAIYRFAMEQSKFAARGCVHTGDNEKMDVAAAEEVGICSRVSWFPALLPAEKKLLDQSPSNLWLNRVIGCSRRARLELGKKKSQNEAVLTGISIGGILLSSYMQWIIRSAVAKGIKRLYFWGQATYVLKHIADILICKTDVDIETHYIYFPESQQTKPSFENMLFYGNKVQEMREVDIADNEAALVDLLGRVTTQKYLEGLFDDGFQIFYFGLEQLAANNNCLEYVFFPGEIFSGSAVKKFFGVCMNNEFSNYLEGIEKLAELFCEDGKMAVELEDMEQIFKMVTYVERAYCEDS